MQQIKVKIIARAKRDEIVGWQGDVLKIRLKAGPIQGKANEALVDFLAKKWKIAKSDIGIIRGLKSKNKILEVDQNVLFE